MPLRPAHLPDHRERSVLQALLLKESDLQYKLAAVAGPRAIEKMIKKGWIIRIPDEPKKFAITTAGKTAMAKQI